MIYSLISKSLIRTTSYLPFWSTATNSSARHFGHLLLLCPWNFPVTLAACVIFPLFCLLFFLSSFLISHLLSLSLSTSFNLPYLTTQPHLHTASIKMSLPRARGRWPRLQDGTYITGLKLFELIQDDSSVPPLWDLRSVIEEVEENFGVDVERIPVFEYGNVNQVSQSFVYVQAGQNTKSYQSGSVV